ncbi:unnamed protein product [Camellia sinensis]
MGFNSVYRVLQEVFPQVDTRMLRAVAIEHSKDADAAVEAVVVEVIPYLSKGAASASGSSNEVAVEDAYHPGCTENTLEMDSKNLDEPVETLNGSPFYDADGDHDQVCGYDGNEDLVSLGKHEDGNVEVGPDVTSHLTPITMEQKNSADDDRNGVNTESEETILLQELSGLKVGSDQGSHVSSTTSKHVVGCTNGTVSGNQLAGSEDFNCPSAYDLNMVVHEESRQKQSRLDVNQSEVENFVVKVAPSPIQECEPDAPEGSFQLAVINGDHEKPESSGTFNDASTKDISSGEMVDFEDEPTLNIVVTRSGQVCRIDLLEDIIEDARNNKKILFLEMESIISLMREVELQEKAAEEAKEEAVRGGLDILTRMEDLKKMLQHAKEANDMHAGEVYGEKAILATEVRELQSRLLSLSDERDKSLAVLDEMRQTLEERLDAAEKVRKAAEQEKMEKEDSARNALAEQELIMEKVVQESKVLKQEAEENSKLQEFLMDRGRVVDMLQGEISVICQDVKLLKEKFDDRVPLSKSLSSSQTSCRLASSSSSVKSMAPDQVAEHAESSKSPKKTSSIPSDSSESPKKTSPIPSVGDQPSGGEERAGDDRKALVDDGWEFFDNRDFYM